MAIVIKTNVSQATPVTIPDMGVIIPALGGSDTFVSPEDLSSIQESRDLRSLTTNDAFGAGSSTLILNDGTTDVAQTDAVSFLSGAQQSEGTQTISQTPQIVRLDNLGSFKVQKANGTDIFTVDTVAPAVKVPASDFIIPEGFRLRLDGDPAGDTYIESPAANVVNIVAGGLSAFQLTPGLIRFFNPPISNVGYSVGNNGQSQIRWNTAQTLDSLWLGLSNNVFIISPLVDVNFDFQHTDPGHPTLYMHSSSQVLDEWASISHNSVKSLLQSGKGDTTFVDPVNGTVPLSSLIVTLGDMAVVQARRTAAFAIQATWTDVDLDTTDLENETATIDHDNTLRDRVNILQTGVYLIAYNIDVTVGTGDQVELRVRVNDATVIPGSELLDNNAGSNNDPSLSHTFVANLTAGDFITLQSQGVVVDTLDRVVLDVVRLAGPKGADGVDGAPGPPGSGSTLNIQEDGSAIPNTPHSVINFKKGIVATDAGAGVAQIDLVFGSEFQHVEQQAFLSTTAIPPTWQQHVSLTTPVIPAGTYKIEWFYVWSHDVATGDFLARVQVDNTTDLINPAATDGNQGQHAQEPKDAAGTGDGGTNQRYISSGFAYVTLTNAAHAIDLDFSSSDGVTSTIHHSRLSIFRVA